MREMKWTSSRLQFDTETIRQQVLFHLFAYKIPTYKSVQSFRLTVLFWEKVDKNAPKLQIEDRSTVDVCDIFFHF